MNKSFRDLNWWQKIIGTIIFVGYCFLIGISALFWVLGIVKDENPEQGD